MKLIVCGTGSTGNTYLLTNGQETLVLDCGIRFLDVKKALNFQIKSIVGAICTHVHGDHHAFAHEYKAAGIAVWEPYKVESLRSDAHFGSFHVQSFKVVHDVPCCGFLIKHQDFGKLLYVTDTEYVRYRFKGLNVMLIEANYDARYIDETQAKYRHVLTGHMSLQTSLNCIRANTSDSLNHVILCHLSANNGNPVEFKAEAIQVVPPGCTVNVAVPGLTVNLNETPF